MDRGEKMKLSIKFCLKNSFKMVKYLSFNLEQSRTLIFFYPHQHHQINIKFYIIISKEYANSKLVPWAL